MIVNVGELSLERAEEAESVRLGLMMGRLYRETLRLLTAEEGHPQERAAAQAELDRRRALEA